MCLLFNPFFSTFQVKNVDILIRSYTPKKINSESYIITRAAADDVSLEQHPSVVRSFSATLHTQHFNPLYRNTLSAVCSRAFILRGLCIPAQIAFLWHLDGQMRRGGGGENRKPYIVFYPTNETES